MRQIAVINAEGIEGTIPLQELSLILESNSGYKLVNPDEPIEVINAEGIEGTIPLQELSLILESNSGYKLVDSELEQNQDLQPSQATNNQVIEGDDIAGSLMPKAIASGVLSIADLPQTAYGLGKSAANYISDKLFGTDSAAVEQMNNAVLPQMPMISDVIKKGVNNITGVDLTPKPTTAAGRIVAHAGEFAGGSLIPLAKGVGIFSKFAKPAISGAGIGATSGVLQEGGVNPLVADIGSSLALPYGAKGISRFSKAGREEAINAAVNTALTKQIGEKNLPKVLEKLDAADINGLTTAELVQDPGISALHRAMAPNIPAIAEKQAAQDAIMRNRLAEIASGDVNLGTAGETIRDSLFDRLNKAKQRRTSVTKPLYEARDAIAEGVNLPNTIEYLGQEGKYAKGDIQNNLQYVEKLLQSNEQPQNLFKNFERDYGHLGSDAQQQLRAGATTGPIPVEIGNALKVIDDKISAAKRTGNNNLARVLMETKENILADMAHIPEERIAREAYARESKPVSAIEKQPLLKKFTKKDIYEQDFLMSPEKITDDIWKASTKDTQALMKQLKGDNKAIKAIKSSLMNKIMNSVENAGVNADGQQIFSYDKVRKLMRNKDKLKLIFDSKEMRTLEDLQESLRRRNYVRTFNKPYASS